MILAQRPRIDETGVLILVLAAPGGVRERPFSCLESDSFDFMEAAGCTGHLDFILAGELRTKASGRSNSIWENLMRSWEGRNIGRD